MSYLLPPPPAYTPALNASSNRSAKASLSTLPDHLILQVLSYLDLPTLAFKLRRVSRKLWLFSSVLLRRAVLPTWRSKLRPGYTSDVTSTSSSSSSDFNLERTTNVLASRTREQAVLDLFVSACALRALHSSESSLLVSAQSSASTDVFDFLQPRARVEDLVMQWGIDDGVLYSASAREMDGRGTRGGGTIQSEDVAVQLSSKVAKVLLPMQSSNERGRVVPRVVLEVAKESDETLEVTAERIVRALKGLRVWREEATGKDGVVRGWYEMG